MNRWFWSKKHFRISNLIRLNLRITLKSSYFLHFLSKWKYLVLGLGLLIFNFSLLHIMINLIRYYSRTRWILFFYTVYLLQLLHLLIIIVCLVEWLLAEVLVYTSKKCSLVIYLRVFKDKNIHPNQHQSNNT
jgi:hypothetical protein